VIVILMNIVLLSYYICPSVLVRERERESEREEREHKSLSHVYSYTLY